MTVSRETFDKFETYRALLEKWQKTINLVGAETLADAEKRHFEDSLQLIDHIGPEIKTLCDWGSGAGFPGLVIAMARPDIAVTLVDSDQRKCAFLRVVSRETKTKTKILDSRLDEILLNVDLITARAFAPLAEILRHGVVWARENTALRFLLLKGQAAAEEIEIAKELYSFNLQVFSSKTEDGAAILLIDGLTVK